MDHPEDKQDNLCDPGNKEDEVNPEKDEYGKPQERLGFREIVPGPDPEDRQGNTSEEQVFIPEFNLDRQMMTDERRMASARRRGPGDRQFPPENHSAARREGAPGIQEPKDGHTGNRMGGDGLASYQQEIIAAIVRRDIALLCENPS